MIRMQTRRRFLTTLSFAGAGGFFGAPRSLAAEGALETTTVRLPKTPGSCDAPIYIATELLRAEGFTDIRYVEMVAGHDRMEALARAEMDFAVGFAVRHVNAMDAGLPITVLAGLHAGCFELFADERIRSITELKGKRVGLQASPPALLILMAAQVGLDPAKDISWVNDPSLKPLDLFADGKIDAFLGFPPEPQELRARHAGHVIVSTAVDRPWSQYFCCMIAGNPDYVRAYPTATKRVLRAFRNNRENIIQLPMAMMNSTCCPGSVTCFATSAQAASEMDWRREVSQKTLSDFAKQPLGSLSRASALSCTIGGRQ